MADFFPKTMTDQIYRGGRQFMDLPVGWNTGWKAGLASGNPQITVVGTSISAGEAGGTQTDALTYGYVGRLKALLLAKYSLADAATFYGAGGLNPGLTSPTISNLFTWTGAARNYDDGGFGQAFGCSDINTWDATITVTGAVQLDLFLIDGGTNTTCQYQVDANGAVTVTGGGGNNTNGNGHLRRVSIPLSGNTTVKVGQASVARAMSLAGFTIFNSTTAGLMIARAAIQGYKAVDFAVGGGVAGTGSSVATTAGALSQTPDHIKPWSGITDTFNLVAAGFPVGAHLAIIEPGTNDISYRTELNAWERAIQRKISAFRAARPNCSIIIPNMCYPGIYSTNAAASISPYAKQKYMNLLQSIAARNNAAFINIDQAFTEDPITPGYMVAANIHPTSNGAGAGGGDGHQFIAQLINQIL